MDRFDELAQVQKNWQPPAGLIGGTPRPVRLAGGGIVATVLAGLLFAAALAAVVLLGNVARREATHRILLREQGREADDAVITRLWRTGDKEDLHMVAYEFGWDGRTYKGSAAAAASTWRTFRVGAPLAVRFVPDQPEINHPRDWEAKVLPKWLPFLIGAFAAGIGVFLLLLIRRQANLLSEGRPAPALIVRHSRAPHNKKYAHWEFPILSGAVVKGRSGPGHRFPEVGATICVVYDRDNPRHNARYPMDFVKLASND